MTSQQWIEINDRDYTSWTILYDGDIDVSNCIDPKENIKQFITEIQLDTEVVIDE